jgi:hypothetical protein
MTLLNKFSRAAVTSFATFLALATMSTDSAKAALLKFSFEGDGANGYFIYDTDTEKDPEYINSGKSNVYRYSVRDYKVDVGPNGVYQGRQGDTILFQLRTEGAGIIVDREDQERDIFQLEVRGVQLEPQTDYSFLAPFYYPKDSFGGSTEQPTSVPSTAELVVYPVVRVPDRGQPAFVGTVQTRIERVPEPSSLAAVWVLVGAGFTFCRRQSQQK